MSEDWHRCTCMRMDGKELYFAFERRLKPVVSRLLSHGHRINPARIGETAYLCLMMDRGPEVAPQAWDRGDRHAVHLPECPWRRSQSA